MTHKFPTVTDAEWAAYYEIESYVYQAGVVPLSAYPQEQIAAYQRIDAAMDRADDKRAEQQFDIWCQAMEDIE